MVRAQSTLAIQPPGYLVGADGSPMAVIVDIITWQSIVEQLEDIEDNRVLRAAAQDLRTLARGERPAGWKSWDEFEAELDTLAEADALPA